MKPVMLIIAENPKIHNSDVAEKAAIALNLSEEDKADTIKSGRPRYIDRTLWSLTYLRQAKLIHTNKGHSTITDRGAKHLNNLPETIDPKWLLQFPEFASFHDRSPNQRQNANSDENTSQVTPTEQIRQVHSTLLESTKRDLLDNLKNSSPTYFEHVIVELMLRLGYGWDDKESGSVTGKSGDGGIDGVVHQDRLGLESVLLQAKKYADNTVGIGEVHSFIGALTARGARKGVFITTSTFSKSAREAVEKASTVQVSLIDGEELAELMISCGLGVTTEEIFTVYRIDKGYFEI
ncbi:MAG: restriction endonuclease [Armatimonadetes bacterium]|nr:restriction endonuclease [Armatimonadota bacterium]